LAYLRQSTVFNTSLTWLHKSVLKSLTRNVTSYVAIQYEMELQSSSAAVYTDRRRHVALTPTERFLCLYTRMRVLTRTQDGS
jgi:hypothetical protein